MPVKIGADYHVPPQPTADLVPDYVGPKPDFVPTISMEEPWSLPCPPEEFEKLPKEQQEILMNKYRFGAIRLRSDIRDRTIPLTKETLDIP